MIGLDTNVLLRYLVQDDAAQSARATEVVEHRLTEENPGFISLVTVLEVVWALKSHYRQTWPRIAEHIEMLLAADTLEIQNEQEVYQAVVAIRKRPGSFEDGLIGALGVWRGCSTTLTFDEKAALRLKSFSLI